jgi:hypothetical protein
VNVETLSFKILTNASNAKNQKVWSTMEQCTENILKKTNLRNTITDSLEKNSTVRKNLKVAYKNEDEE